MGMEEFSKFHTVRGYQRMEKSEKILTSAMEDYLEMIYRNSLNDGLIRINILSELLNVAAPSATKMVQNLSALGFVHYKKYGYVFLTEKGRETGEFLYERHNTIETLLKSLDVDEADLLADTELIEHDISENTLLTVELFNRFMEANPNFRKEYIAYKRAQTP